MQECYTERFVHVPLRPFALLATGVDNLTLDNLKVDTNRDGFDIDCCKNVRISRCSVNTPWDDAIVLKSSYALGYFKDTERGCVKMMHPLFRYRPSVSHFS